MFALIRVLVAIEPRHVFQLPTRRAHCGKWACKESARRYTIGINISYSADTLDQEVPTRSRLTCGIIVHDVQPKSPLYSVLADTGLASGVFMSGVIYLGVATVPFLALKRH